MKIITSRPIIVAPVNVISSFPKKDTGTSNVVVVK
jgi:hypothetical protein